MAAGALGNLAAGNDAQKAAIVAAGAIPPLEALLLGGLDEVKKYAAAALANIACSNATASSIEVHWSK